MTDRSDEAHSAVRNSYRGFAALSRLEADRAFTVDVERVTDNHFRYEASYRLDDEKDDYFEGDVYYEDGEWVVDEDHDV